MKKSSFTGSAWGLFGWNLLIGLSFMLFIIPAAFVIPKYVKWYYDHVIIDDEELEFTFDGPWFGFLWYIILISITFGLAAPYAVKKIYQWETSNTRIKNQFGQNSEFTGSAWMILGYGVLSGLSVYLFAIPLAWLAVYQQKWINRNTVISNKKLTFDYEGPWFGIIGWMLFSIFTLGIGSYYAQKKQYQFFLEHTHFE